MIYLFRNTTYPTLTAAVYANSLADAISVAGQDMRFERKIMTGDYLSDEESYQLVDKRIRKENAYERQAG